MKVRCIAFWFAAISVIGTACFAQSPAAPAVPSTRPTTQPAIPPTVVRSADGKCEIVIDTSAAPDLKEWVDTKLAPTLAEWYPKIVEMLPSPDFKPPTRLS